MYVRNAFFNPIRNIDGFVFVSNFSEFKHRQHMPQFSDTKSIVAYNTIPPLEEKFISRNRGEYFLFFGRLSNEKGINTLVNAFISNRNAKLKIVGTGPEEDKLKKRVIDAEAYNIEFAGYRSGDALKEIIRDAAFVIVPSECYENNPMTIVEAYSAGVPVIGAKIGGIPEIVDEGKTGFLFTSGDSDALSKCIEKTASITYEDYAVMSENARTFAANNFNEDKNYEKLIDLYQTILKDYEK